MPSYCKAYQVKDLKKFSGWNGKAAGKMSDEDICYLWPDLSVTKSCLGDKENILVEITTEWKKFCTGTLKFRVPDDLKGD